MAEFVSINPKGMPGLPTAGSERLGWNAFDDDVPLPLAVLLSSEVDHNIQLMADYCAQHGVQLAPHGKTTMTPELIHRQLAAGAWAVTVATAWQAAAVVGMGAHRIVLANEVTDRGSLRLLAELMRAHPDLEMYCYVDSLDSLALLEFSMPASGGRFRVLLELGMLGGRTGLRDANEAFELGRRISAGPLPLAGVAAYEGLIDGGSIERTLSLVDSLLERCTALALALSRAGYIGVTDPILTAGGSSYFDRVVAVTPIALRGTEWRTVLRSGCYVTHDNGTYEQLSPLAGRAGVGSRLRPALQVLAAVLSRPEPGRAILGLGRRDASSDAGLPVPLFVRRDGSLLSVDEGWTVVAVNDQHAYLDLPAGAELRVGEVMGFGISHPCTTFDKWRVLPLVNPDYTVLELAHTWF